MKKILLALAVFGLVPFLSACVQDVEVESGGDCVSKCEAVLETCSEVITYDECVNGCNACGVPFFDEITQESDCDNLRNNISQCGSSNEEGNDCDKACLNYNSQCLVHVPNADQDLYDQGYESCMDICKDWSLEKIECMEAALDCPSMTEVCGL
jgi:hypothetical protein